MCQSGSGKSMGGGNAVAGHGFDNKSIRFRVYGGSNKGFIFENASEERLMSIRGSDGLTWIGGDLIASAKVGIGTTSPDATLHVSGGGDAHVEGDVLCDSRVGVKLGDGVAPSYELHVNGDAYVTGEITAMSDRRVKRDIRTITDATEVVERLRGCRYTRSDARPGEEDRERVGLIAQEVREVLPEVVESKGEYLGVSYGPVVGVLVEALKASNGRVRDLEAQRVQTESTMKAFQERLAALEAR